MADLELYKTFMISYNGIGGGNSEMEQDIKKQRCEFLKEDSCEVNCFL